MKRMKEEMCWCYYRFLHLDLVDLDAEQFVFKIVVEIETVSVLHIFSPRVLVEDTCFSAGQGLQCTPELPLLCTGQGNVIKHILLPQPPTEKINI